MYGYFHFTHYISTFVQSILFFISGFLLLLGSKRIFLFFILRLLVINFSNWATLARLGKLQNAMVIIELTSLVCACMIMLPGHLDVEVTWVLDLSPNSRKHWVAYILYSFWSMSKYVHVSFFSQSIYQYLENSVCFTSLPAVSAPVIHLYGNNMDKKFKVHDWTLHWWLFTSFGTIIYSFL